MTAINYYNENDTFAAAWLRELIKMGHIAPGVVDERDIRDITPAELAGYTQCHFFAGIGVWSYALRRAGWPDDIPVWTGSCPCQPFSAAGRGGGVADERHLWPHWFHLIQHGKPDGVPVFGEQVASKDGLGWLDLVQTDMEGTGYACWPVDLCAAGVGAPHIRQRLFFVAERVGDPSRKRLAERIGVGGIQRETLGAQSREAVKRRGDTGGMADTPSAGPFPGTLAGIHRGEDGAGAWNGEPKRSDSVGGMADAECTNFRGRGLGATGTAPAGVQGADGERERVRTDDWAGGTALDGAQQPGPTNGIWRDADWLYCRDGKWRPVEPGTFPLVDGAAARVGRLRGYGNAINAEVAAAFVGAYLDLIN